MKKILILLSILMIDSPSIAMQCTFQKIQPLIHLHHTKAFSFNHEKKSQIFPFDPNQVLTIDKDSLGNSDKLPFCNYKHVIAYPKILEKKTYNDIKIAVIDSGINFQRMENTGNLNFTKESSIRFYKLLKKLSEQRKESYHLLYNAHNENRNHTIQVCGVIENTAPGIQLDLYAINHGMPYFIPESIGEKTLSTIDHNPHFINISYALHGRHPMDHPFLIGELIPIEIVDAFLEAKKKGIGIIFAAGNNNMDVMRLYPNMPELLEQMSGHLLICCGTAYNWMLGTSHEKLQLAETRVPFSNYFYDPKWMKYGISAPAEGLFCSQYPSEPLSGTSYSAPMVAATAAILKSTFPTLSAVEIFDILKESSRKQPLFEEYTTLPHIPGVLNVTAALELAKTRIKKENRK